MHSSTRPHRDPHTCPPLERALRLAHAVEAACEAALAGGRCGVAVVEGVPIVDPSVPYGALWEFPTAEAHRAHLGRRAPRGGRRSA